MVSQLIIYTSTSNIGFQIVKIHCRVFRYKYLQKQRDQQITNENMSETDKLLKYQK